MNKNSSIEFEELRSAAMFLAVKCLRSFDPSKGTFSTYYYNAARVPYRYVIFNTTLDDDYQPVGSLQVRQYNDEEEQELIDLLVHNDEELDELIQKRIDSEALHRAVAKLPARLRRHAHDTMEGKVTWENVKATAMKRREMLEELRTLLDIGPDDESGSGDDALSSS